MYKLCSSCKHLIPDENLFYLCDLDPYKYFESSDNCGYYEPDCDPADRDMEE